MCFGGVLVMKSVARREILPLIFYFAGIFNVHFNFYNRSSVMYHFSFFICPCIKSRYENYIENEYSLFLLWKQVQSVDTATGQEGRWEQIERLELTYIHCAVLCFCHLMDCSSPGSSVHGDSSGKNTGMDSLSLLQGIFLTQN